jgi:hypothetical protein
VSNDARARPPIALITGDFVKTGGMDRANYALASYLLNRGDEVHLAAYRVSADLLAKQNAVTGAG